VAACIDSRDHPVGAQSVIAEGERLRIVGAFYLLRTQRMLPVEADLSVAPGATSTIRLGTADSSFPLPQSERQFLHGLERASWHHEIELRLGL
jgi:hypothetical protein